MTWIPRPCPLCTGEQQVIGHLGRATALRCRHCGMTYTLIEEEQTPLPAGRLRSEAFVPVLASKLAKEKSKGHE